MPRSTREWALRKLLASQNNIDWCMKHVAEVGTTYAKQHPEISENLLTCYNLAETLKKGIAKVRSTI